MKRLEMNEQELENVKTQFETAKVDVEKPFNQEEELKTKTARLYLSTNYALLITFCKLLFYSSLKSQKI